MEDARNMHGRDENFIKNLGGTAEETNWGPTVDNG
jgi:hypothetical protein